MYTPAAAQVLLLAAADTVEALRVETTESTRFALVRLFVQLCGEAQQLAMRGPPSDRVRIAGTVPALSLLVLSSPVNRSR